ncbi:MAG TPA: transcriptional repressor LexA [Candidatus Paceibacterota bacterium]|nr:transcriptional repressor LexA [Candidatus Paceibacterota bacterium]
MKKEGINTYKDTLVSFYKEERRMPTYTEMMKMFGFKSKNAVYRVVQKFIDAGIVAKDHLGRLMPSDIFGEVPLLGSVKAGFPADVEGYVREGVHLEEYLVRKKESTYMLEVDGDSMIDAHIADGDMVLVEKTENAKDGDIVIAEVDGEWTMKYLRHTNGKPWLEPANKDFPPIHPKHSFHIAAVVKAVIRKY